MMLEQQLVEMLAEGEEAEVGTGGAPESTGDMILRLFLPSRGDGRYPVVKAEMPVACPSVF